MTPGRQLGPPAAAAESGTSATPDHSRRRDTPLRRVPPKTRTMAHDSARQDVRLSLSGGSGAVRGRAVVSFAATTAGYSAGITIEVNDTDAEGRLVLEDCITHPRDQRAERLVDLATLKGGIVGALGSVCAGLKGNDDELCGGAAAAGGAIGNRVWRLPLDPLDDERIKGRYADISNLPEARTAHLITVGALLYWFAGDVPWAHLDIAGVSDGAGARMRARARGRAAAARARAPPRD
jgi:hypothetical protein